MVVGAGIASCKRVRFIFKKALLSAWATARSLLWGHLYSGVMIRHNNNHYDLDAYPLFVARRPTVFAPGLLCHRHGARQLTTADLSFGWGTIKLISSD